MLECVCASLIPTPSFRRLSTLEDVKLARFMGRPKDRTPKAFFREVLG